MKDHYLRSSNDCVGGRSFSRRHGRRRHSGFTLMEVLLVLIILVVIGSIVAPSIFGASEKANLKAAEAQISPLKGAIRMYFFNMNKYPASLNDLMEKPSDAKEAEKWGKPYLDDKLPPDPWDNEYQYANPGKHNTEEFDVWSNGPDGQSGTDDDIGNWDK
jgi:general secretion pathway protein G